MTSTLRAARLLLIPASTLAFFWALAGCSSEPSPVPGGSGGAESGGAPGAGGAASGGTSAGGATAGGASSGGAAAGGAASGGAAAGGASSGGSASGGESAAGGGEASGGSASGGTSGGEFTLTSSDWTTDGAPIDPKHTCDGGGGQMNWGVAPQLTWTNPPEGTMSYAFFMIDWTLTMGASPSDLGYHSMAWNIPTTITELPSAWTASSDLPGAMAINGGYLGPCPPSGVDTYHLIVMAMPEASYTVTGSGTTGVKNGYNMMKEVALAVAEVTGTYTQQ